jgi:hypothetical protein
MGFSRNCGATCHRPTRSGRCRQRIRGIDRMRELARELAGHLTRDVPFHDGAGVEVLAEDVAAAEGISGTDSATITVGRILFFMAASLA